MTNTTSYFQDFMNGINDAVGANLKALPIAIILAIIFYVIYKVVNKIFRKYSQKLPVEKNVTKAVNKIIDILIIFFAIMIIASALGINTSSLIAAFSIFGLAISLSVQNIMSNVANAINIYANRPFKIDDYVDIDGTEGTVIEIGFMFTKIRTYKNEMIYMPNSKVGSAIIKNYSYEKYRRIEYTIGVSYDNDIEKVKKALLEVLNEDEDVVKSEEMVAFVNDYASSSINFTIRAYTKNESFLKCLWNIKEHIKPKFDKYGITIPYPQLDVLIKNNGNS
ncbi:MAG: mechanosensitive ion channel [Lachnospiraceae bacterium]|nr:mechanosensitive ion channel [Lachnospiraceae bacterium]